MECSCTPFPLTPTLSQREGEPSPVLIKIGAASTSARGSLAPSPWGAGWGEGECDRQVRCAVSQEAKARVQAITEDERLGNSGCKNF